MKRTVFLVDDHPMLRDGLRSLIDGLPGYAVNGEAETAAQAIESVPALKPELVVMDLSLPDRNGLELLKDLLALCPDLLVLIFSMHDEFVYAERAIRAGAKGYLMKGAPAGNLVDAMESVLTGGISLSSGVSASILKSLAGGRQLGQLGLDRLTDRELEIFELIGRGMTSSQIAEKLHISSRTVDAHRFNIRSKLGFPDAPAMTRQAVLWVERGE